NSFLQPDTSAPQIKHRQTPRPLTSPAPRESDACPTDTQAKGKKRKHPETNILSVRTSRLLQRTCERSERLKQTCPVTPDSKQDQALSALLHTTFIRGSACFRNNKDDPKVKELLSGGRPVGLLSPPLTPG
ncbi:hypothetical protein KUCAC02_021307, partial [Chaenocephalus aceratus]